MAFLIYIRSMCKYCGYEHGIIPGAEVVCPVKQPSWLWPYKSKKIPESNQEFRQTKTEPTKDTQSVSQYGFTYSA